MQRLPRLSLLVFVAAALLAACGAPVITPTPSAPAAEFNATVTEVLDGSILVDVPSGEADFDRATVRISADTDLFGPDGAAVGRDALAVGQGVRVVFNGVVAESYPVQLTAQAIYIVQSAPPAQQSISGIVWHDLCAPGRDGEPTPPTAPAGCVPDNGSYRANGQYEEGEPGISGVVVTLAEGDCAAPGNAVAEAVTDITGRYRFDNLAPGDYCVAIDPAFGQNVTVLLPGGWTSPAGDGAIGQTVNVQLGQEQLYVDFGWDYQFLPALEPVAQTPVAVPQVFTPLADAAAQYQGPGTDPGALIEALRLSVSDYLATQAVDVATARELVQILLAILPVQPDSPPQAVLGDVDSDGKGDLLLTTPFLYGVPAHAFLSGHGYRAVALPERTEALAQQFLDYAFSSQALALDMTGDGQNEALITYFLPGGSGTTERLIIFRWLAQTDAFDTIMQAELVNWAAAATWEMQPGPGASRQIVLKGAAFGVFDHKLLPHPTRMQTWQWDETAGRFVLAAETVGPPTTQRQQINVAEAALQAGQYEEALRAYQRVLDDGTLTTEDDPTRAVDWRAFAQFRIGLTHALLGQVAEARAALAEAQAAGSTIGHLATAFADAYQGEGSIVAAWAAMMNKVDLAAVLYNDAAGNVGFPMTVFPIHYPGLAIAASLDEWPAGEPLDADRIATLATAQGLEVSAALAGDVTGDGDDDLVFVTPAPDMARAWLAYRQDGRWRVAVLAEGMPTLALERMVDMGNGQSVVIVRYPEGATPTLRGFGWHDGRAVLYDVPGSGQLPTPVPASPWPTIGIN